MLTRNEVKNLKIGDKLLLYRSNIVHELSVIEITQRGLSGENKSGKEFSERNNSPNLFISKEFRKEDFHSQNYLSEKDAENLKIVGFEIVDVLEKRFGNDFHLSFLAISIIHQGFQKEYKNGNN